MDYIDTKGTQKQGMLRSNTQPQLLKIDSGENRESEKILFGDDDEAYIESNKRYSLGLKEEDSFAFSSLMLIGDDDMCLAKIRVYDPQKDGKNVVYYNVFAFDSEGEFKCRRRYSDFEGLREAWKKRLPGLYHPFLPPKKLFGNTERSHIEERMFLLE